MSYQIITKFRKFVILTTCFLATIKTQPQNQAFNWSYQDLEAWKEHVPSCGGEHQSPINLVRNVAVIVDYPNLMFGNYEDTLPEIVTNNGHTMMMSFNQSGDSVPFISGGGIHGKFNFVQMHFHWGLDSMRGSEHFINSRPYSAEVHLVHYNTKYDNFSQASTFQDGLAVLAVMIDLEPNDNIAFRHLEKFSQIIDPLNGQSSYLPVSVELADLLPDDTSSFFRYNGSLTTPGCNEDVIWTVLDNPIFISERQLIKFRQLRNDDGEPLTDNFRPLQELHNRLVTYRRTDTN